MKIVKYACVILTVAILVSMGCDYRAPLTEEHTIAVDRAVLGLWEEVPKGDKAPNPNERMLILRYSDTEYLIHYPAGKDGLFFRGYPIKIGGVPCVQIELIGSYDGDLGKEDRRYQVIRYTLSEGILEVETLNTDLVARDLEDSASLRQAFLKNKEKKNLFRDPARFQKVSEKR